MSKPKSAARQICEDYLQQQISQNNKEGILPSENLVAERLLARGDELNDVYEEAYAYLYRDGISWKIFLGCLLSTGAFWSTEKIAEYRTDRHTLIKLNQDIAKQAQTLASLLTQRDDLHNRSDFRSGTHYNIIKLIDQACAENGRYKYNLKEPLAQLSARFDRKYWPSLADCIQVIGCDAENAKIAASDPLTEAATRSTRPSKADFIRALCESIDENRGDWLGAISKKFGPSNANLATLANVLLELPPEEIIDATYVKNLRHRDKVPAQ